MSTLYSSGDSVTFGYGVTSAQAYINRLAAELGLPLVNKATGGDMAADQSIKSQSVIMAEGDVGTIMIGINDHKRYKADAAKHAHYRSFLKRCIGNFVHPNRISARTLTRTGTWANSDSATGIQTTALNAKVTGQVMGRYISIGYIIQNNNNCVGSRADVFVDGVLAGDFSCDGYTAPMNTINGAAWGCALAVFDAGTDGLHTVDIVNAISGKKIYVDDIRGSDQISVPVIVGNVIKMAPAGYSGAGTSEANVNALCAIIADVIAEFQSMGHDVRLADVNSSIDPLSDLLPDGVHPNGGTGHPKLFDEFMSASEQVPEPAPDDPDEQLDIIVMPMVGGNVVKITKRLSDDLVCTVSIEAA